MFYPHERSDFKLIDAETNIMPPNELENLKSRLKDSKHACLYVRLEHPRKFEILF